MVNALIKQPQLCWSWAVQELHRKDKITKNEMKRSWCYCKNGPWEPDEVWSTWSNSKVWTLMFSFHWCLIWVFEFLVSSIFLFVICYMLDFFKASPLKMEVTVCREKMFRFLIIFWISFSECLDTVGWTFFLDRNLSQ